VITVRRRARILTALAVVSAVIAACGTGAARDRACRHDRADVDRAHRLYFGTINGHAVGVDSGGAVLFDVDLEDSAAPIVEG
jgi:hypothetical protein